MRQTEGSRGQRLASVNRTECYTAAPPGLRTRTGFSPRYRGSQECFAPPEQRSGSSASLAPPPVFLCSASSDFVPRGCPGSHPRLAGRKRTPPLDFRDLWTWRQTSTFTTPSSACQHVERAVCKAHCSTCDCISVLVVKFHGSVVLRPTRRPSHPLPGRVGGPACPVGGAIQ